ncbi:MAG: histidine--tRNA ligase [Syntrophorhabdaceae bacterium]|nr:histidine--tRNA ligase [Syntrophorhabdaceae bacterium]
MEKIRTLRGFRDIFGEEMEKFRIIEDTSRHYFKLLGFNEIEIPALEKTELFTRSIGDATDIVEKEMFTFVDAGGDSLTLRPEATAGVVRFYLQEGMYVKERVSKLFTIGSMFRHERPQKGRFRQFHQIDVEVFGVSDPFIDAELLWLISLILDKLMLEGYSIEVNSVGCRVCRNGFRDKVVAYFETKRDMLCEDCLRRLERSPLRIFDCKKEGCIKATEESPFLFDSLCKDCNEHFDSFLDYLGQFKIKATLNKRLVRGLDYYTKTVFEVTSENLGAQKAFIAGGRYDNLVEEMGGPPIPGIGFAIGVERLSLITSARRPSEVPLTYLAYLGKDAKRYIVPILERFVSSGYRLFYSYEEKSLKSQMRYADSLNAEFVLILGEDEIKKNLIILRSMRGKWQKEVPLNPDSILKEVISSTL